MTPVAELEERRNQALADLAELAEQVTDGSLDPATAEPLRRGYERAAADAIRALERRASDDAEPSGTPVASAAGSGPRWRLVAASVLAVAAVGAALALVPRASAARPDGGFVTGNEAVAGNADGRDLATVTNEEMEAVVTQNPDVVPMRLRLAHRYLDAGDDRKAVEHYMQVLDRDEEPEAMSHLGWLLFNDGEDQLAEQLLTASLERVPDDPEATWFLANLRVFAADDAAAAVPLLERLLERDDLGDQRADVDTLLAEARRLAEDAP